MLLEYPVLPREIWIRFGINEDISDEETDQLIKIKRVKRSIISKVFACILCSPPVTSAETVKAIHGESFCFGGSLKPLVRTLTILGVSLFCVRQVNVTLLK